MERLVQSQIQQSDRLHPLVDTLVPLPQQQSSLIHHEKKLYEEEEDDDDERDGDGSDEDGDVQGINIRAYENDKLLENLYYTLNHRTNLTLLTQNVSSFSASNQFELDKHLQSQITEKRKQVDDLNEERKKRQLEDFKPVEQYLTSKWQQGLNTLINLNVEAQRQRQ